MRLCFGFGRWVSFGLLDFGFFVLVLSVEGSRVSWLGVLGFCVRVFLCCENALCRFQLREHAFLRASQTIFSGVLDFRFYVFGFGLVVRWVLDFEFGVGLWVSF